MSLKDLPLVPVACTVALCPTFEDKPLITETFWDILIPSDSLNGAAAVPNVQLFQLLKAVALQLVIDQATNVHHHPGIVVSFQDPSSTALATVRVPDFSNGVNLEIFGFRSFPDTLEACMATPADPSFAKIVFASDTGHYITKLFLSNSPEILSGFWSSYPHPHFILLLRFLPGPTCQPSPTPLLPFPNQDLFPELESQSFSPPNQTTGYPLPPSVPALNNVETFRDYLFHTQGQDTQAAVYLREGFRKRPLWAGIRNHNNACRVLQQAGFMDSDLRSSSSEVFFELPNGRRLSMDDILTELDWHVDTFQKKYRLFNSCSHYARSYYWRSQTLNPTMTVDGTTRHNAREQKKEQAEIACLLPIWKGIVAMFGPEGYAWLDEAPVSGGDTREKYAAELRENHLKYFSKIKNYLARRHADMVDSWF